MSSTQVDVAVPEPLARTERPGYRWRLLAVISLAQLMVVLDGTIVSIALPSAQKALDFNNDGRQWIVTAYSLTFGGLLLLGGRLADLLGRKTTFRVWPRPPRTPRSRSAARSAPRC